MLALFAIAAVVFLVLGTLAWCLCCMAHYTPQPLPQQLCSRTNSKVRRQEILTRACWHREQLAAQFYELCQIDGVDPESYDDSDPQFDLIYCPHGEPHGGADDVSRN